MSFFCFYYYFVDVHRKDLPTLLCPGFDVVAVQKFLESYRMFSKSDIDMQFSSGVSSHLNYSTRHTQRLLIAKLCTLTFRYSWESLIGSISDLLKDRRIPSHTHSPSVRNSSLISLTVS